MPRHQPRKRFGQHFLHDRRIIQRIVTAFAPRPDQCVVEIGPGEGALTALLLERVGCLEVIEIDRDLAESLAREHTEENLHIHNEDVLEFDFPGLARARGKPLRVIGNLPYNISTPLLFHLLSASSCMTDMLFMLQKEVVDRMVAKPNTPAYGRLSVMIQYYCQVEKLFTLGPGAFNPPPRVDSAVISLSPHVSPPVKVNDDQGFARLVARAFSQRRKTLRNNLKGWLEDRDILQLGLDPACRAETLSLEQFAALYAGYVKARQQNEADLGDGCYKP